MQKIGKETYKKASLENYQQEIFEIWPQLGIRPALHTWARVVKHATTACEGMRRNDWGLVLDEIATTIVWWLAFIQKLNLLNKAACDQDFDDDFVFGLPISATEIVWRKYPGVCPVEFGLAPEDLRNKAWDKRPVQDCMCLARKKESEERSEVEKKRTKKLVRDFALKNGCYCPRSIDALEDMLRMIFSGTVYHESIQELFFHFIEEIGEVSEALADATTSECLRSDPSSNQRFIEEREEKRHAITEELADVFSWSVSVVAKVQAHLESFEDHLKSRYKGKELKEAYSVPKESQHISLSGIIWQKYGLDYGELRCNDCNARPCVCIQQHAQPLYRYALDESHLRDRLKLLWKLTLD